MRSARPFTLLAAATLCTLPALNTAEAQSQPQRLPQHSADLAVGYVAERSLRIANGQNFWLNGGGLEAGITLVRGFGVAANVTGSTTNHVGTNGVPLSLVTFTAGPRMRLRPSSRVSYYGEVLVGLAHGFKSVFPATQGSSTSASNFALLAGGGMDVRLYHSVFVRPVEASYMQTRLPNGGNNVQNTLRLGASFGFSFGR